ncbi:thioesterase [bacterium]|nr:thioesterase [bacterium]
MKTIAPNTSWIARPKPNPAAHLRLFTIPHAGGSVSMFYPWLNQLPVEIELCPIQLPGRENRLWEEPFTDLLMVVQTLLPILRSYLDLPFAFFGHSMGALIGFELARHLRRQYALEPIHLFVSGREPPQLPDLAPPIHRLPESEFVDEIRHRYNGISDALLEAPELLRLLLPVLRADVTIVETYRYIDDLPLNCSISAFGGLQDRQVRRIALMTWQQQTQQSFQLHMLPGDHFFLNNHSKPFLYILCQELNQLLKQLPTYTNFQSSQFSYTHRHYG